VTVAFCQIVFIKDFMYVCMYVCMYGMRSIAISVSVCLCCSLPVRLSPHISQKITCCSNFTKFLYMLPVDLLLTASNILRTSDFVDEVMFADNRANGPTLKTTLFRLVRQVTSPGRSLPSLTASCFKSI